MDRGRKAEEGKSIYRIPPYYYLHVLDQNTNVTKLEIGPKTFIRQDNEKVVAGPEKMIVVPPRHYCVIENPAVRDKDSEPVIDRTGQVKLRHADEEIRLAQDPFPLYPGEHLKTVGLFTHLYTSKDTYNSSITRIVGFQWRHFVYVRLRSQAVHLVQWYSTLVCMSCYIMVYLVPL